MTYSYWKMERSKSFQRVVDFLERPLVGIAIGIVVGAIGALISVKWLLVSAGVVLVISILREKWGAVYKILVVVLVPGILVGLWYITPKPKEPTTPEQLTEALCLRSPWLCSPPQPAQAPSVIYPPPSAAPVCRLKFSTATEPVARLYSRHPIPNALKANLSLDFQEMFYEWRSSLTITRTTKLVAVKLNHLTESDLITVSPASRSEISDLTPEWFSGFREPARTKADYYSRLIRVSDLASSEKVTISLRRALDVPQISPILAVRIDDARAENCSAPASNFDENQAASDFNSKAKALAEFRYGQVDGPPHPLPMGRDPGDVGKDEVQATIEARCKNPSCTQIVVSHLEVHTGQIPKHSVTVGVDKISNQP